MLPWYQDDRRRDLNYDVVVQAVLSAAAKVTSIGWLTWGSPRVLDSVSQKLMRVTLEQGFTVEVIPAISSIDTVLIDVDYDPVDGLMVIEGTTAIRARLTLTTEVAVLIFQPGTFGSDHPHLSETSPPVDLHALSDYLLRFYEPDHPAAFVSSSVHRDRTASKTWTTIANIGEVLPTVLRSSTIYIPRVQVRARCINE